MAASTKVVDPVFQGVGQTAGLDVWRIENFQPVPVPKSDIGKFYTGDSYIILKTTVLKSGAYQYDVHFWLGSATSQDEAGTAAIKTVELDAALGDRAVQYREVQGHETDKFLSYFKPCIIPLEGGVASGFKQVEKEKFEPRLFTCKGRRAVRVQQVPYARESLNHDDVFILDTEFKIYQFNGSTSSIQERAKALGVVQHIKETYHDGTCDVAVIDDDTPNSEADTEEFWSLFGGFAPIGNRDASKENVSETPTGKLFIVEEGQLNQIEASPLTKDLLDSNKCLVLDCGAEIYVWTGRGISLEERKAASVAAEEYLSSQDKPKHTLITRVIQGCETLPFRTKFDSWPLDGEASASENGRKSYGEAKKIEKDPRLFACSIVKDKLEAQEVFNFEQTDLLSEDVMVLDAHNEIFAWVGQNASPQEKEQALYMAQKYVEQAAALEGLSADVPLYKVTQGNEPESFIKHFDEWDVGKAAMQGDSFQKGLSVLLGRPAQTSSLKVSNIADATGNVVQPSEYVSYERLKAGSDDPAPGVDPERRETYLSPDDFKELFGMESEQFYKLPKWKQEMQKKALDLF